MFAYPTDKTKNNVKFLNIEFINLGQLNTTFTTLDALEIFFSMSFIDTWAVIKTLRFDLSDVAHDTTHGTWWKLNSSHSNVNRWLSVLLAQKKYFTGWGTQNKVSPFGSWVCECFGKLMLPSKTPHRMHICVLLYNPYLSVVWQQVSHFYLSLVWVWKQLWLYVFIYQTKKYAELPLPHENFHLNENNLYFFSIQFIHVRDEWIRSMTHRTCFDRTFFDRRLPFAGKKLINLVCIWKYRERQISAGWRLGFPENGKIELIKDMDVSYIKNS